MKTLFKFLGIFIFGILCWLFVIHGWCGQITYQDHYVRLGKIIRPISLINPHSADVGFLKVWNRTYKWVRGTAPCYIEIPELKSILFVTEEELRSKNCTFHMVNISNGSTIDILSPGATFGGQIGTYPNAAYIFKDSIKYIDTNRIVAITEYPGSKKSYYLNLLNRKVERVEYLKLDEHGHTIETILNPD